MDVMDKIREGDPCKKGGESPLGCIAGTICFVLWIALTAVPFFVLFWVVRWAVKSALN